MNEKREHLGSRLGFIMLSAGCAIGCGNVWKFPWMTGENGGGSFVLIYILFLILLGLPTMTMEFAMGRASQASVVGMYKKLQKPGSKWNIHGYFALAGNVALMAFYTVVTGWGWDGFVSEVNSGKGLKIQRWMKPIFKYLVPILILCLYIYGLVTFDWK